MDGQVFELSSDSEIEFSEVTSVRESRKNPPVAPNISLSSDDEFPDIDFGISKAKTIVTNHLDKEFRPSTFTHLTEKPTQTLPEPPVTVQQAPKPKSKNEKAYEKALKAAETANKKSSKITDCLKLLDSITGCSSILSQLESLGVKHKIENLPVPKSIYWKRENVEHFVDSDLKVSSRSTFYEEKDALVIILASEFSKLARESLKNYHDNLLRLLKKDKVTLILYGMAQLLREKKTRENKRFKDKCTEKNSSNLHNSNVEVPLNEAQVEEAKIQLLLERQCSIWPAETADELAKTIGQLTKAVAERPFKEDRFEQPFDFYGAEACFGGVKVSKDGQGLSRLWQQQIQQFPLVALDTSQAILSRYPTPCSLAQAYKECPTEKEASLLLQEIPVRRNAGPLSTTRKVGPELSKRVHKFMTSQDGTEIL